VKDGANNKFVKMNLSSSLKVYSPGYQATEWGFGYDQMVDLDTALAQPHRIVVMPVYHNDPADFSYRSEFENVPLHKFDLVLFTDIEWRSQKKLIAWIETMDVKHWLLHTAGIWLDETPDPRVIYRPAWSFNFLRWNPPREDFPTQRPYAFECLLGARREHRDFTMLSMQQSGLLEQGIVTYRDFFIGHWIDQTPRRVSRLFDNTELMYPYVSSSLDPAWEVKTELDNSISGLVPWEIYNRTWFSIVCETLSSGRVFLSAEKMGKCLQARRLFVVFAIQGFLQHYRDWGFETFGDVLDESYDQEANELTRWTKAFEQVQWLCKQDLPVLLQKLRPRLDHNHNRLYEFEREKTQELQQFVMDHLK
jgi:hypothetical protein